MKIPMKLGQFPGKSEQIPGANQVTSLSTVAAAELVEVQETRGACAPPMISSAKHDWFYPWKNPVESMEKY